MVKQRRTPEGKHAGIILNAVLTEVDEEYQQPLWDEYTNARGMEKHACFVRAKLLADGKHWSPGEA